MHVAILGTYPPTRCGIATFTADVEESLQNLGTNVTVISVDPAEVKIGTRVEMTFRRILTGQGVHNYFWKAKPIRA